MCTESIHIKIPSQSQIIFETKIYERISAFVCSPLVSVCECMCVHVCACVIYRIGWNNIVKHRGTGLVVVIIDATSHWPVCTLYCVCVCVFRACWLSTSRKQMRSLFGGWLSFKWHRAKRSKRMCGCRSMSDVPKLPNNISSLNIENENFEMVRMEFRTGRYWKLNFNCTNTCTQHVSS